MAFEFTHELVISMEKDTTNKFINYKKSREID